MTSLLAASLAATSCLLLSGPVAAQGMPESMLPEETLFFVGTDNMQALVNGAKQSAIGKIIGEEEVQDFLGKPKTMLTESLAKVLQEVKSASPALAEIEIDPAKIMAGPYGQAFVALTHVTMPTVSEDGQPGKPDVGLVVGLAPKQGAIDLIGTCQKLLLGAMSHHGMEVKQELVEVEGGAYEKFQVMGDDGPGLVFAKIDGTSVVSLSELSIKNMLLRAHGKGTSLQSCPKYLRCVEVAGSGGGGAPVMFMDLPALLGLARSVLAFAAQMEEEAAMWSGAIGQALDSLQIEKLGPIYAVSNWEKGVAVSRSFIQVQPGAGGICKSFTSSTPVDLNLLKLIPKKALSFQAFHLELAPIYDALMSALATAAPEIHGMVQAQIKDFAGQVAGVNEQGQPNWDIEKDFIRAVGGQVFYMSVQGQASLMGPGTDTVGWVEAAKPQAVEKSLEYLCALPGQLAGMPLTFNEEDHNGVKLHVLDPMSLGPAAMMAASMQPTYAVHGNKVYFASKVDALKKMLDTMNQPQENDITAKSDFAQHFKRIRQDMEITALSYSDVAVNFETTYTQIMGVVPMLMMGSPISEDELPIELSLLPTAESISQHLFGSMSVSYRLPGGSILAENYGPFGAELGLVAAGGVLAGTAMFALRKAEAGQLQAEEVAQAAQSGGKDAVERDLNELKAAITVYIIEYNSVPSSLADLVKPSDSYPDGLLLRSELPKDPWGNDYFYKVEDEEFSLWSCGENCVDEGGAGDDIRG